MLALSIESVICLPLQALIAEIFSLFSLRLLHTCRTLSSIYLRFAILTFFFLPTTAWIVASDPLGNVRLIFSCYMFF